MAPEFIDGLLRRARQAGDEVLLDDEEGLDGARLAGVVLEEKIEMLELVTERLVRVAS